MAREFVDVCEQHAIDPVSLRAARRERLDFMPDATLDRLIGARPVLDAILDDIEQLPDEAPMNEHDAGGEA